jgi:hypothetical protein
MGRGRSTTGIVIAAAVRLWERRELWNFPDTLERLIQSGAMQCKRTAGNAQVDPFARHFLEGHYEAVGALTRVLDHGVGAKAAMDAVIDCCDAMQNLREAIYPFKQTADSKDRRPCSVPRRSTPARNTSNATTSSSSP